MSSVVARRVGDLFVHKGQSQVMGNLESDGK